MVFLHSNSAGITRSKYFAGGATCAARFGSPSFASAATMRGSTDLLINALSLRPPCGDSKNYCNHCGTSFPKLRWGWPKPLFSTHCAKQVPQGVKEGSGEEMTCQNLYTFSRLWIMAASPCRMPFGCMRSSSGVVTKTGLVPDQTLCPLCWFCGLLMQVEQLLKAKALGSGSTLTSKIENRQRRWPNCDQFQEAEMNGRSESQMWQGEEKDSSKVWERRIFPRFLVFHIELYISFPAAFRQRLVNAGR